MEFAYFIDIFILSMIDWLQQSSLFIISYLSIKFWIYYFVLLQAEICYLCKMNGYPLPTVYQGKYNAVTRLVLLIQ